MLVISWGKQRNSKTSLVHEVSAEKASSCLFFSKYSSRTDTKEQISIWLKKNVQKIINRFS